MLTLTTEEKYAYDTIYDNSILFLKRAIREIVSHDDSEDESLDRETALISCLFIQMTIELSLKAFLINNLGLRSILDDKYNDRSNESVYQSFLDNTLQTKKFESLKNTLKNNNLTWLKEEDFLHIDQFQLYRNKLVHVNLFLTQGDLFDLKYELIYVIVHILIPLLTFMSFEFETPSEFYSEHLYKDEYEKLIHFPPYVDAMTKLSINFTGLAYNCPNCYHKAYSPINSICYCCNLNYEYAADYVDCLLCKNKQSVIYDPNNIEGNHNIINGLCLSCDERPNVFKCFKCDQVSTFFHIKDLVKCNPDKCINE